MLNDIRYSIRMLMKRPGFTAIVVITLALGIGVNTALFTAFNIFLRPKPVKDPESIVRLTFEGARRENRFSFPDYVYLRDHNQSFSELIAAQEEEKFLLGENKRNSEPEEILGNFVSDNYFSMLGGSTLIGRSFTTEENSVAGRDAVVVLSHRFWQRRFGGDRQLVGRSLLLNGKPFTVIGVTNPAFVGLRYEMPDVWLPLAMRGAMPTVYFEDIAPEKRDWYGGREFQWLTLHARLKPGKTIGEARAEMEVLLGQLKTGLDTDSRKNTIGVEPINELRAENEFWGVMALVLGASGLVLLIACFNIANMQLARAISRQKEICVRLCLGAGRWRLVRQLLTESLLLAGVSGVAGVLLAWWSLNLFLTAALSRYGGGDVFRLSLDLSPDRRVLAFSFALALLSGIAFGLVPALRATRADLIGVIKSEGANASGRANRSRLSSALIVAQVSLCFVLLIPAGLLLRSVQRVLASDPGFEANKLLSVGYSLELSGYDAERAKLFQQQFMARLSTLPGVQSVSLDSEFYGRTIVTLLDQSNGGPKQFSSVPVEAIPETYLDTIGAPIVLGRSFTSEEVKAKAPVLVVSESTARNLWPGESALGKLLRIEQPSRNGATDTIVSSGQVVGVARDNQINRVGQTPPFFIYVPGATPGESDTTLLVRTSTDAAALKDLARREAYALEPVLRLFISTFEEKIAKDRTVLSARGASHGATFLGMLALMLASVGIYGVMAWSVVQRSREIGIRMALGAQQHNVLALVLRQGMKLVLLGVVIGLPASLAATTLLKSMLFGLSATDVLTIGTVTALLLGVTLVACYLPARRATRVDPLETLRYE
ncbi:MAG TPA: ABC transporter permease [Pyrinomonadaceae bacterium]|nr:ABC transporter permease [Pyrinomonadaceae bacterium]